MLFRSAPRRDAGDEPVLPMRARPLGVLLLSATCAMSTALAPVSAQEPRDGRIRVATERLDMTIALEGADPLVWRACHPSPAPADPGPGASGRPRRGGDPPLLRLV